MIGNRKQYYAPLLRLVLFLWLLSLLYSAGMLGTSTVGAQEQRELKSENFTVVFLQPNEPLARGMLEMAEQARIRIFKRTAVSFREQTRLVICRTQKEFQSRTNFASESIVAAAVSNTLTIYLNAEKIHSLPASQVRQTLVHEYAHLFLGRKLPARLPRWANEGLAMHLAGQWSFGDSLTLTWSRILGTFIPFRQLVATFPQDDRQLHLAYLQSYSMINFLIKRRYPDEKLNGFLLDLTDSKLGPRLIEILWDPVIRDGLETAWRRSLGSALKNWFLVLTSATVFWFLIALLFILAYIRKQRERQEKLRVWEEEERIYSSLDEADEDERGFD